MKGNEIDRAGERLSELLSTFKLPSAAAEIVPRVIAAGHETTLPLLAEIFEIEQQDRWERRVQRLLRAAKLPPGKRLESFDDARLARPLARQIRELAKGAFLEQAINVLAFGLPGTGKTHVACALGQARRSSSPSADSRRSASTRAARRSRSRAGVRRRRSSGSTGVAATSSTCQSPMPRWTS